MKITYIKPNRADIKAHLQLLKPAFNGVEDAKTEYQICCDAVNNGQAGLYQINGAGVNVRFVGIVTDENDYLVLALTGRGIVPATQLIIEAVKGQGYRRLTYHTVRAGMTRILRRYGFVHEKVSHGFDLTLDFKECK